MSMRTGVWKVEAFDGTKVRWEIELKAWKHTESAIIQILCGLACTQLTPEEVISAMTVDGDDRLAIARSSGPHGRILTLGEDPHFVAKHFP